VITLAVVFFVTGDTQAINQNSLSP